MSENTFNIKVGDIFRTNDGGLFRLTHINKNSRPLAAAYYVGKSIENTRAWDFGSQGTWGRKGNYYLDDETTYNIDKIFSFEEFPEYYL